MTHLWVLILVILGSPGQSPAINSVNFTSKETCQKAGIMFQVRMIQQGQDFTWNCTPQ